MISETPIEFAGRQFFLRYSTRDLIRAEAALNKPIIATLQKGAELTMQDMSTLIRFGLKNQDMTPISAEAYDDILDQVAPFEFIKTASEALNQAFKTPSGTAGKN